MPAWAYPHGRDLWLTPVTLLFDTKPKPSVPQRDIWGLKSSVSIPYCPVAPFEAQAEARPPLTASFPYFSSITLTVPSLPQLSPLVWSSRVLYALRGPQLIISRKTINLFSERLHLSYKMLLVRTLSYNLWSSLFNGKPPREASFNQCALHMGSQPVGRDPWELWKGQNIRDLHYSSWNFFYGLGSQYHELH